jgi:tRNA modification GTPase
MNSKINSFEEDTVCAIATANGIGSISIVRVSGPQALSISQKLLKKTQTLQNRVATLATLIDKENQEIDKAIVLYFQGPKSFTGEDIVEFQCHGGIGVSSLVLDTLLFYGARLAQNGEFSKRAFLNGKIDLSQAEAIAKLIEAKSEDAVKLLARQLKGDLSHFVDEIKEDLIYTIASCEVSIDYAEEDLPDDLLRAIESRLQKTVTTLTTTLEASKRREGLISGFKVAIVGKPNAGKSSLLNALLNYNRAIVSDIEGTTRDTIEEDLKIGTHIIKIIDTAGIRKTHNEIEKIGIDRSLEVVEEADIIIALFDNSSNFEDEDHAIFDLLEKNQEHKEIIYTLNKIDLPSKIDMASLENKELLKISTKESIQILIDQLQSLLDATSHEDETTLISKRQIQAVEQSLNSIENAFPLLETGELELFSFHIHEAIGDISTITRPYEYDQMLDVMFGSFCLGK